MDKEDPIKMVLTKMDKEDLIKMVLTKRLAAVTALR